MHISRFSLCLTGIFATTARAVYVLQDNYNTTNFFTSFTFFSDPDPTQGFVNYASATHANNNSLAGFSSDSDTIYMGVDFSSHDPISPGRDSVRVHSKKTYTRGLFIADIKHMPGSICGAWPAFWTFGENWPFDGEIDILEGVNDQVTNSVTLHTSPGCRMERTGAATSSRLANQDCNANNGYTGCGFETDDPLNYGSGFNSIGGGVYALEWTSSLIRVFFFPRQAVPSDIADLSSTPRPENWGVPIAAFSGEGCDIDAHFRNHRIVFDTTFCGQWAGNVWEEGECKGRAGTCEEFVRGNPGVYGEAYWEIYGVRVYQDEKSAAGKRRVRDGRA